MEEIIPFKSKNSSFAFNTNLLVKEGNNYLMDNHRMALWCWIQELDLNKVYAMVHIESNSLFSLYNFLKV